MKNLRRAWPIGLATLLLLTLLPVTGCDSDEGSGASAEVKVMTYNLYLGGDLFPVTRATTPEEVVQEVTALWQIVQASRFDLRAQSIADIIEAEAPDLIGLQEVSLYRTQTPADNLPGGANTPATEVAIDFLNLLLAELDARGLDYSVALEEENADVEFPAAVSATEFMDVRLTDRDVILARAGVETASPRTLTFNIQAALEVPPGSGQTLEFTRSAQWVRATVDGVTFTFANAHLEVDDGNPEAAAGAQFAQGFELFTTLASEPAPVVLVGDFNSAADGSGTQIPQAGPAGTTYGLLTNTYTDAAAEAGATGNTCCQAADLRNTSSELNSRIDLILHRGDVTSLSAEVVGDEAADRTPGGLWPSDHAGVVATLRITN